MHAIPFIRYSVVFLQKIDRKRRDQPRYVAILDCRSHLHTVTCCVTNRKLGTPDTSDLVEYF